MSYSRTVWSDRGGFLAVGLVLIGSLGCGPKVLLGDEGGDDTTAASSSSETSSLDTSGRPPSMTTVSSVSGTTEETVSTTEVDGESSSEGMTVGFINRPDGYCFNHCVSIECSTWDQDCPFGEKCQPWANDGGNAWNDTVCGALDRDPDPVGQPCTAEGDGLVGVDSCELGALCWNVDPETGAGICMALCKGNEANPICPDEHACMIANGNKLSLCVHECDPLDPACGGGETCASIDDWFGCLPGQGGIVDPYGNCDSEGPCAPGTLCIPAERTSLCDEGRCCSPVCDLESATPDEPCTMLDSCVPFFEGGIVPPEHTQLGVCGTL